MRKQSFLYTLCACSARCCGQNACVHSVGEKASLGQVKSISPQIQFAACLIYVSASGLRQAIWQAEQIWFGTKLVHRAAPLSHTCCTAVGMLAENMHHLHSNISMNIVLELLLHKSWSLHEALSIPEHVSAPRDSYHTLWDILRVEHLEDDLASLAPQFAQLFPRPSWCETPPTAAPLRRFTFLDSGSGPN
jgi:hypothetical protein